VVGLLICCSTRDRAIDRWMVDSCSDLALHEVISSSWYVAGIASGLCSTRPAQIRSEITVSLFFVIYSRSDSLPSQNKAIAIYCFPLLFSLSSCVALKDLLVIR
jgi:hypothetical protein